MSRISSRFGLRQHPVLRFTRLHAGVDFAAPPGTPILAAGAGHVIEAGRFGGYGNWVKIGHEGGLATGYAHMSRIAPGVKRSARVRQGQVIGYVGSTGLSTGPHLHFELHRGGRPVDPLTHGPHRAALRASPAKDLERFKAPHGRNGSGTRRRRPQPPRRREQLNRSDATGSLTGRRLPRLEWPSERIPAAAEPIHLSDNP